LVTRGLFAAAISAERCEFSVVPIPDEDKGARSDGAGKLPLWLEQISDFVPVDAPNSAEDHLDLALGRLVPDQVRAFVPDGF
jgi:hypothetical protein